MTSLLTCWWRKYLATSSSHQPNLAPWFENSSHWCTRWFMGCGIKISFPRPPQWRHRSPGGIQLDPANSNSVISNSPLFRTKTHFPWTCPSVIYTIGYFELPLFRTIFRSKWRGSTVVARVLQSQTKRLGKVVQIYPITVRLELNIVNTIPVLF